MVSNSIGWFVNQLDKLEKEGMLIEKKVVDSPICAEIIVNGKKVINFSSNNYLGLACDERLKKAAIAAINKFGVGPGAVRTIAGTTTLHVKLEQKLAEFKKVEDCIVFQSGFTANLAVIPAIVGENDFVFSDELNHASIIDACRLCKSQVIKYQHLNPKDLEEKIKSTEIKDGCKILIVSDGVFSMDGDIAPLPQLVEIAQKYSCLLMVDDAHGEGVLGEGGRGVVDHFKLHGKVDIEIGTLSKAFGVVGGFAAGKKEIINWLRQRARPFLFSSAMTIPDVAASIESVSILSKSNTLVEKLWENTKYFKEKLRILGFDIGNSQTPIIPVMLGDEKLAQEFSKQIFELGIFAVALTYPTVPRGKARIRIIISAAHEKEHFDNALKAFEKVGKELGVLT